MGCVLARAPEFVAAKRAVERYSNKMRRRSQSESRELSVPEFMQLFRSNKLPSGWPSRVQIGSDTNVANLVTMATGLAILGVIGLGWNFGITSLVVLETLVFSLALGFLVYRLRTRELLVDDGRIVVRFVFGRRQYRLSEIRSVHWRRSGSRYGRSAIGGVAVVFQDGRYFDLALTVRAALLASLLRQACAAAGLDTSQWL
jgi:hypothetical protein